MDAPLKTPMEFLALTSNLKRSTLTFAAIAALFESGLASHLREPLAIDELVARCSSLSPRRLKRLLAVGASIGVLVKEDGSDDPRFRLADGVIPFAQPPSRTSLEGDVRSSLLLALRLLDDAADGNAERGWRYTDPSMLMAQGNSSVGVVPIFKSMMLPTMEGLGERLSSGGRFLDVGVGVGALSIAMCQTFPALDVVGIDPHDAPLALARENVARAGLDARIRLVQCSLQDLDTEHDASFDLVWMPTFFILDEVLVQATRRAFEALRPGGFLLYPTSMNPVADTKQQAFYGLVTDLWGGAALAVDRAESILKGAGFSTIRVPPGPPTAPAMVIAQR